MRRLSPSTRRTTRSPTCSARASRAETGTLAATTDRFSRARRQLLLLPFVQFAGYKVPHPLESRVVLKVQTDGSKTPIVAVQEAMNALVLLLGRIKAQFQQELNKARALEGTDDAFGGAGEGFY